ncbi:unnamed protein product [Camellia sinensis]
MDSVLGDCQGLLRGIAFLGFSSLVWIFTPNFSRVKKVTRGRLRLPIASPRYYCKQEPCATIRHFFMIVIGFELLCLIGGFLSHELLDHNHIKLGYRITLAIILY